MFVSKFLERKKKSHTLHIMFGAKSSPPTDLSARVRDTFCRLFLSKDAFKNWLRFKARPSPCLRDRSHLERVTRRVYAIDIVKFA